MGSELHKIIGMVYSDAIIIYQTHSLSNMISKEEATQGLEQALKDLKECYALIDEEPLHVRTSMSISYRNHRKEIITWLRDLNPPEY